MAINTNTVNTIFPNSSQDIDRIIISFADDDDSLVKLSCVNKAGNQILTNIFFKVRFDAHHPVLKDFPLKFEKLCNFFPESCWKIARCALSKGEFRLSHTFISDHSPNIHNFILLEKTKAEAEHREICGSFCQDPNSQIDQAWKHYEAIKQLEDAFNQRFEPAQREAEELLNQFILKYPELQQIQIVTSFSILSIIIDSYTDAQLLNPSDEETIAIHDAVYNFLKKVAMGTKSDDDIRAMSDQAIATVSTDFCTFLSSDPHSTRHLCQLISEVRLLLDNKGFVQDYQRNDVYETQKKYKGLEEKRVSCVGKLEKIGKILATFDPSGKLPPLVRYVHDSGKIQCYGYENPHTAWYSSLLQSEFNRTHAAEIAIMRLPHLENCRSLIRNLLNHPEEVSAAALDTIRQMINSCDIQDIGRIWGELYHECANEVHEDQWSEKHFPEFLSNLDPIVGDVIFRYAHASNYITEPNREDVFERYYYGLESEIE